MAGFNRDLTYTNGSNAAVNIFLANGINGFWHVSINSRPENLLGKISFTSNVNTKETYDDLKLYHQR